MASKKPLSRVNSAAAEDSETNVQVILRCRWVGMLPATPVTLLDPRFQPFATPN